MATPHCAIAQDGSNAATSLKACRACSYWKECNRATARLNPGCAAFEHEVKKWTEPISSAESSWWCSCAASPGATIKKNGISKIVVRRMAFLLQEMGSRKNGTRSIRESMSTPNCQVNAENCCSSGLRGRSPDRIDESGHFARAGARVWARGQRGRGFRRQFSERRREKACGRFLP